jgi:hypothetical protein
MGVGAATAADGDSEGDEDGDDDGAASSAWAGGLQVSQVRTSNVTAKIEGVEEKRMNSDKDASKQRSCDLRQPGGCRTKPLELGNKRSSAEGVKEILINDRIAPEFLSQRD